ncbi:MAG: zinc metallopeptidase [Acidobacteriota bacterium]
MPLIFDPLYFLFAIPPLLLSMWASWQTKRAFKKYSRVGNANRLTGAQAAKVLLDRAGIHDVSIVETQGFLSDHYHPGKKQLALSPDVYRQPSISAIGVACHEAGHAIQHATNYAPLGVRSALVPTVGIGSNLGIWIATFGIFFSAEPMILIGALLFSAVVLFQLITLPVEFDASNRAKKLAFEHGLVVNDSERQGMAKVLNAAAMTYVAAAVSSILTLLYFLMRAGVLGGRND